MPVAIRKALFILAITPLAVYFMACLLLSRLIDRIAA